jgi:hypothetical protein
VKLLGKAKMEAMARYLVKSANPRAGRLQPFVEVQVEILRKPGYRSLHENCLETQVDPLMTWSAHAGSGWFFLSCSDFSL